MADLSGQTLLNRYELRQLAGSGGMADVYQAWDQMRHTPMAIKILRRDLALNPRFFQMFAKEAELLRHLEHPNIVRLYELNRDNQHIFIVMDWVDGYALNRLIHKRKKPFQVEEIIDILEPLCAALYFAHQNGVFHCDVKPANILLASTGKVLLTDFGVARLANENTSGGTPPYMAPEQFTGGPINARTDIYAIGIMLYELLSGGQVPFRGDTPNSQGSTLRERICWEHLYQPLPSLTRINPSISEALELVVATAMNKTPEERFATVLDLKDAFLAASQHKSQTGSMTITAKEIRISKNAEKSGSFATLNKIKREERRPTKETVPTQDVYPPCLVCRGGEHLGDAFPIHPKQGLSLGRQSDNTIQFHERSISRRHAVIEASRPRGFIIRDLGSKTGTLVNNRAVNGVIRLVDGDIIQIGFEDIFEFQEK